jgi:lysophospholipase L1-like esterase
MFLVVGELALRSGLTGRAFYAVEMARYGTEVEMPAANPRIAHVHRPGRSARLMDVAVRINSDGLRDDELPRERGRARRLVFLGDSITFGWGVEKEATFERRLERRLSEAVAPTEILNFGTGNYNTTQAVELFLEKGLGYAPDAAVLFYFINDAEPVPTRSRWWWLGHSQLLTLYWSRLQALAVRFDSASGWREYYAGLYRDGQPGWRAARESLLALRDATAARGIRLQVVLLPELHQLTDYPFAREHAAVLAFLAEHGIASLDLAPYFAGETDPRSLWVAPDDAHPNARAHERIARYSFDTLRKLVDEAG